MQDLFQNTDMMRKFAAIATSGGSRDDAFAAFLQIMQDSGVGQSAIDEAKALGPKLLKKSSLPRSIKALAGGLEASQTADQVFQAARGTAGGIPDHIITTEWKRAIQKMRGTNKALAERLKVVDPEMVIRAVRGGSFSGGPPPATPATALAARGGGGPLAKVAGAAGGAAKALPGAAKRGVGRLVGGVAAGAGLDLLFRGVAGLPFREGHARNKAVEGFAAMGKASSAAALSAIVRQQELAARRKMVLQNFEPELFNQMLTALAMNDRAPSAVTATERQIGGSYEEQLPARKSDKDVKFLLDQLMNELSGAL